MIMKAFTNIEQSRKLLEIGISAESADMWWNFYSVTCDFGTPQIIRLDEPWVGSFNWYNEEDNVPCWSLAALLELIKKHGLINLRFLNSTFDNKGNHLKNIWNIIFEDIGIVIHDVYAVNPIDAAVDMIIWLKENKYI